MRPGQISLCFAKMLEKRCILLKENILLHSDFLSAHSPLHHETENALYLKRERVQYVMVH